MKIASQKDCSLENLGVVKEVKGKSMILTEDGLNFSKIDRETSFVAMFAVLIIIFGSFRLWRSFFCFSMESEKSAHMIPTTRCSWTRVRIRKTSRGDHGSVTI